MSTLSHLLQHQHGGYHNNECNTSVLVYMNSMTSNASAIHAFPHAIFHLAIGELPLKKIVRWAHGKDMLHGTIFWMLSWGHTVAEMYIVD